MIPTWLLVLALLAILALGTTWMVQRRERRVRVLGKATLRAHFAGLDARHPLPPVDQRWRRDVDGVYEPVEDEQA